MIRKYLTQFIISNTKIIQKKFRLRIAIAFSALILVHYSNNRVILQMQVSITLPLRPCFDSQSADVKGVNDGIWSVKGRSCPTGRGKNCPPGSLATCFSICNVQCLDTFTRLLLSVAVNKNWPKLLDDKLAHPKAKAKLGVFWRRFLTAPSYCHIDSKTFTVLLVL